MRNAGLLSLAVLLAAGCGKSSYKVIDIPYCQVPDGHELQGFAGVTRYVYNTGSSWGFGPVSGTWPSLGIGVKDSIDRDSMVLAVVSCPSLRPAAVISDDDHKVAKQLTTSRVPELCAGQKVLFHGPLKTFDDAIARERGYNGIVRFPEIASLTCPVGTLRRTASADIEPRPR